MEHNPIKLFQSVLIDSECIPLTENYTVHDLPDYLTVLYTNENGEWGYIILDNWDKNEYLIEYDGFGIIITDDEYEKFCSIDFQIEPVEFLNRLNLREYDKLLELIDHYSIEKRKYLKGDSDALEVLDAKIKSLNKFKKVFMKWFVDWKVSIPTSLANGTKNHHIESNEEARARTETIKRIRRTNRQLQLMIDYLKKYRSGNLTDKEIEQIADSCRRKNGRINYTAMGKIIGLSKDTVRNLIKKRNLIWLIDKPDSYTPQ